MRNTTISVSEEDWKWIHDNSINLSRFVRARIKEVRDLRGGNEHDRNEGDQFNNQGT